MISTNNKIRNENLVSTGSLAGSKRVFSTFHLSSTRTNQRTCCIDIDLSRLMQQVRDQVFDKKVESVSKACCKPAGTCRKPGCKPGRKPGLQLARIMECGLYKLARFKQFSFKPVLIMSSFLSTTYLTAATSHYIICSESVLCSRSYSLELSWCPQSTRSADW